MPSSARSSMCREVDKAEVEKPFHAEDDGQLSAVLSGGAAVGETSSSSRHISRSWHNSVVRCEICLDTVDRNAADVRVCQSCRCVTCGDCFVHWLESKILSGHAHHLRCVSCPTEVCPTEVFSMCGERTFRKLSFFLSKSEHRTNPHAIWCPVDGCWQLVYGLRRPPSDTVDTVQCPRCVTDVCVKCHQQTHAPAPCATPRPEILRATKARIWTRVHTKACPECAAPIQRAGGCKHMRCLCCNAYFCWLCKGILTDSASAQPVGRPCICSKLNDVLFWASFTGAAAVSLPVIGVAIVLAAPPGLFWFALSSKEKKRQALDHIRSLLHSF